MNWVLLASGATLFLLAGALVWARLRKKPEDRSQRPVRETRNSERGARNEEQEERPEVRSQRPVLPKRERPLTELQVRTALRVDADNPLWVAVHQLIEQQVEEAKFQVADAENQLRPQLLSFYAGGINVLERLQGFLVDERERALSEVEEE